MAVEEVGARLSLRDRVRFSRDARTAATDVERLGDAADDAATDVERAERAGRKFGRSVGKAVGGGTGLAVRGLDNLSRRAGSVVRSLGVRGLTGAAGGLAVGLPLLGYSLVNTAANLEGVDQKARVVFGTALPGVTSWAAKAAAKMGLTQSQAVGLAAGFADLLVPMGFTRAQAGKLSSETLNLAGALSQWSGGQRSAAEVADILADAMLGETDSLKGLGIAIGAADIQARLSAKGQDKLTGAALQQATALATQALILEKSTDAQAAYAAGGLPILGSQARIRASVGETRDELARKSEPYILRGLGWLERTLPKITTRAKELGGALRLAFELNGATGVVQMLDHMTGSGGKLTEKFTQLRTIWREILAPTGSRILGTISTAFGLVADHTTTAYVALGLWLARSKLLLAARVAMLGYAAASGVAAVITGTHTAATTLATGATQRQTVAHYAARGALMAQTAATGLATVATTVWGVAVRAAAGAARLARTAALLMWAAATGPIGLAVIGLAGVVVGVKLMYDKFDSVRTVVDAVWGAIKRVVEWVKKIDFPSMPSWLGGGDDKPEGRAVGGPIRPGRPYLVGEQGPELVVPRSSGHVVTAPQTAALLGSVAPAPALVGAGAGGGFGGRVTHEHRVYLDGRELTARVVSNVRSAEARR